MRGRTEIRRGPNCWITNPTSDQSRLHAAGRLMASRCSKANDTGGEERAASELPRAGGLSALPSRKRLRWRFRRHLSQLHARLIAVGELDAGGLEVRRASRRSDHPAMLGRKGSEKCMVTTTTDLIEDWIQMRSTLQRQLKMLESGTMPERNIPDSTTRDTTIRVRRCIDELNSLLKEYASSPKP